jgi:hypothetical protein
MYVCMYADWSRGWALDHPGFAGAPHLEQNTSIRVPFSKTYAVCDVSMYVRAGVEPQLQAVTSDL